jgi:hypothetical protein
VKQWCIAPTHDAAFVAAMEDVLDVYERPYDPTHPVVCMDETSKQLVSETRTPIAATTAHPALVDYEYRREGVANMFLFVEPLAGQRQVTVTAHRTKTDWAHAVRAVLDGRYADAERVVLVLDNLNTHTVAALYETFPAAEAHRLARRLELHYTPKHGSWLNMAEIELSVLTIQCLKRRIPSVHRLTAEVAAWQQQRNARQATITWHFTTANARVKLRHLYPAL